MPCWTETEEERAVLRVARRMALPFAVELPMHGANIDLVQLRDDGLHALEFKFKDWRRCFQQAYRHNIYAEWCWCVMLKEQSAAAAHCEKYGIGYATFTMEGELRNIVQPRRNEGLFEPMANQLKRNFEKFKEIPHD